MLLELYQLELEKTDHYKVLGITSNASSQEITYAYRKLALKYHPDRNKTPHANEIMLKINTAYDILSDPGKRREYDFSQRTEGGIYYKHYINRNTSGRKTNNDFFDPGSRTHVKVIIVLALILKIVVIKLKKLLHSFFN